VPRNGTSDISRFKACGVPALMMAPPPG